MVLGKFFKSASLGLSPDIPVLPAIQGSSCVFVSGCAGAILGLSFLAAGRAGVFHGTRELPGPCCLALGAPHLCRDCLALPDLQFLFLYLSFPIAGKEGAFCQTDPQFSPCLDRGERMSDLCFLNMESGISSQPLWKHLPGRLHSI